MFDDLMYVCLAQVDSIRVALTMYPYYLGMFMVCLVHYSFSMDV